MSGATFTVVSDPQDMARVLRALDLTERAGRDPRPLLKGLGEVLVAGVDERFQKEEAPDGTPWAKLSEPYRNWKMLKGRIQKILQSTGIMRGTINYRVIGSDNLAVGSPMEYAAIHQFGKPGRAIIRPHGKKTPIPGTGTPARPFLGISSNDKSGIDRALKSWIRKILETS